MPDRVAQQEYSTSMGTSLPASVCNQACVARPVLYCIHRGQAEAKTMAAGGSEALLQHVDSHLLIMSGLVSSVGGQPGTRHRHP